MWKAMKFKVYSSYEELFLKCLCRPRLQESIDLTTDIAKKAAVQKNEFSQIYFRNALFYCFLEFYRKKKYITNCEYILSLIYSKIYRGWKFIIHLFLKKQFEIFDFEIVALTKNIVVFDIGNSNLIPGLDIDFDKIKLNYQNDYTPTLSDRVKIFSTAFVWNVWDVKAILQFMVFSRSYSKLDIDKKLILVEEGMDIKQQFFLVLSANSKKNVIVSQRGPIYCGRYMFGFEIIVDNSVTLDKFRFFNNKVAVVKEPYLIRKNLVNHNKEKTLVIGYIADIGDSLLNKVDKRKIDKFVIEFAHQYGYSVIVSVHPQEIVNSNRKLYYDEKFDGETLSVRTDKDIESFFNNVDIVIGWYSTALFQAFIVKKPVIILDLFFDFPMQDFVQRSEGLMCYARSHDELNDKINYFYTLQSITFIDKYEKALKNLGIFEKNKSLEELLVKKYLN
jgi:hypothetical protein